MKLAVSVLALVALGAVVHGKSFEGYQVLRITPNSMAQFQQLMSMEEQSDFELDFWRHGPVGEPNDVMVPPYQVDQFKELLEELGMEYVVHFSNVQPLIDEETRSIVNRPRAATLAAFDYNKYHTYQEISDWVTNFRKENSGGSLRVEEFALPSKSYEERAIKGLKLTTGSGRLGAYTQGGIHAREWVSPATVINLVKKFVDAYNDGDDVATEFFSKFDWYVIPLLNVDGYYYTWPAADSNRMWRKNRQPTSSSRCTGTDMNRNYGYKWGGSGSTGYRCSEAYRGSSAYSAVELKTVTDWLLALKKGGQNFMIHVDVHSYSQYWVYPFSYTYSYYDEVPAPDKADLDRVAKAATAALTAVHGKSYQVMQSGDWYPAAGASEDFGYVILKAKYSYTIEMRDTGLYGFELPENQIQPCGEETYAGFREMFRQILQEV